MIPNAEVIRVQSSGVQESEDFSISEEDMPKIMGILRNTLYTRKVDAILREYGTNAWDAHQEAGLSDRPIKVTLPTTMNPTLSIRDYGAGLSPEQVLKVYTRYGKSTKRNSNKTAGMLGIGSKSGFCYSESFTIISWHGGWKRIYIAALESSGRGNMSLLDESELPADQAGETGIEIQIPAKRQDIWNFEQRAQEVFAYFEPLPEINTRMPNYANRVRLEHGYVDPEARGWTAVMGCVSYHINLEMVQEGLLAEDIYHPLSGIAGGLRFEMGEVEVSANREDLEYTDQTKAALVKQFLILVQEYVANTIRILESTEHTDWEKRLKVVPLTSKFHVELPPGARAYALSKVPLFKEGENPKSFVLINLENTQTNLVPVESRVGIYIKDDSRSLSGFHLNRSDVVIRPTAGANLDVVRADLDQCILNAKLTGIPVRKLSEMHWVPNQGGRNPNEKHKVNSFEFKPRPSGYGYHTPYSNHWEITDREATDDDVFLVISGFQARSKESGGRDFYECLSTDQALVARLGGTMPTIYGYKTTEKRPVKEADCQGKSYWTWRKEYILNLVTPEMLTLLDHWRWNGAIPTVAWEDHILKVQEVVTQLGEQHPVSKVLLRWKEARLAISEARGHNFSREMEQLDDLLPPLVPSPAEAVQAILDAYPLLQTVDRWVDAVRSRMGKHWLGYIKMVDDAASCSDQTAVA